MENEAAVLKPSRMSDAARQRAADRMRQRWSDDEYRARMRIVQQKNVAILNSNPEFTRRKVERLKQCNADPEFDAKRRTALKASNSARKEVSRENLRLMRRDPEFNAKRIKAREDFLNVPENNPIRLMDKHQLAEYKFLMHTKGFPREEALKVVLADYIGLYKLIIKLWNQ